MSPLIFHGVTSFLLVGIIALVTLGVYIPYRLWIRNLALNRFLTNSPTYSEFYEHVESQKPATFDRSSLTYREFYEFMEYKNLLTMKRSSLLEPPEKDADFYSTLLLALAVVEIAIITTLLYFSITHRTLVPIPGILALCVSMHIIGKIIGRINNQDYLFYAENRYKRENPRVSKVKAGVGNEVTDERTQYFNANRKELVSKYIDHN